MNEARSFAQWLVKNASLLQAGHELLLPFTLAHPSAVGFKKASLAPFGQLHDWTLGLRRGRIVVHELAHGQCIVRLERPSSSSSLLFALGMPGPLFSEPTAARFLIEAAQAGVVLLAAALVTVGSHGLASFAD